MTEEQNPAAAADAPQASTPAPPAPPAQPTGETQVPAPGEAATTTAFDPQLMFRSLDASTFGQQRIAKGSLPADVEAEISEDKR